VVEHLPSKLEALSSDTRSAKRKKEKEIYMFLSQDLAIKALGIYFHTRIG
jgi:hypothetical protein